MVLTRKKSAQQRHKETLDEVAEQIARDFVNGNRSDVKAALSALSPLNAAAAAARAEHLLSTMSADQFVAWLKSVSDFS